MILQMNLFFRAIWVYIICMDNKTLLLTILFLLAACAEESTGPHYTTLYDELEHEVSLTDLYGLDFTFQCVIDGDDKRCEASFFDFKDAYWNTSYNSVSSSTTRKLVSFKNASLLSIQVQDESSNEVLPLISYFQDGEIEMKGASYDRAASKIRLNGYYKGDVWVDYDTTISIGKRIRTDADGKIAFSLLDSKGNRVRYEADLGEVLRKNDENTLDSVMIPYLKDSESTMAQQPIHTDSSGFIWTVDTNAVTIKPEKRNFEIRRDPADLKSVLEGNSIFLNVPIKNNLWTSYLVGVGKFSIFVVVKR